MPPGSRSAWRPTRGATRSASPGRGPIAAWCSPLVGSPAPDRSRSAAQLTMTILHRGAVGGFALAEVAELTAGQLGPRVLKLVEDGHGLLPGHGGGLRRTER